MHFMDTVSNLCGIFMHKYAYICVQIAYVGQKCNFMYVQYYKCINMHI